MPHSTFPLPELPDLNLERFFQDHPALYDTIGHVRSAVPQSGLTNRVFRLDTETGGYFLRLPRPDTAGSIDRAGEAHNLALAADLGLAVRPVYLDCTRGVLVTRAVDGPVDRSQGFASGLGTAIGRLHGSGVCFSGRLDPVEVVSAQGKALAACPRQTDQAAHLAGAVHKALGKLGNDLSSKVLVPSHGDLSPGNCLQASERLWLIDWEYSAMADPAWDLAYASLENEFSNHQEADFLTAYQAADPKLVLPSSRHLEIMKGLCDGISGLWALEQICKGRREDRFLAFANTRMERAFTRLAG